MSILQRLQHWYLEECNEDWEHTYGIKIDNIDNPGWVVTIDLLDTYLFGKDFKEVQIQREDENDWILCKVKNGKYEGIGGPLNLEEVLVIFLDWAETLKTEYGYS